MADDKDARVHQEVATPPPPVTVGSVQQQVYSWNQNSQPIGQPIGQPVMNDQLKKMLQPKGKNKGSWSTPATKDIQRPGQPKADWKQQSWTKSSDKSSWDKKSSWNSQDGKKEAKPWQDWQSEKEKPEQQEQSSSWKDLPTYNDQVSKPKSMGPPPMHPPASQPPSDQLLAMPAQPPQASAEPVTQKQRAAEQAAIQASIRANNVMATDCTIRPNAINPAKPETFITIDMTNTGGPLPSETERALTCMACFTDIQIWDAESHVGSNKHKNHKHSRIISSKAKQTIQ